MTRRVFTTEDGWYVATGWDRQLQHFFIDISKACECVDGGTEASCPKCRGYGDIFAYNNLDDPNLINTHGGMTFIQVREILDSKLTEYPRGLLAQLSIDCVLDLGNDIDKYPVTGRLKNHDA